MDLIFPVGVSYNASFSVSKLKTVLSQCHGSSMGPVDVLYAFLRNMSYNAFTFLLDLYNLI